MAKEKFESNVYTLMLGVSLITLGTAIFFVIKTASDFGYELF